MATIPVYLIAPCGMNCRLCRGYLREKNSCPGCLGIDRQDSRKSTYPRTCKIKHCEQISSGKNRYCSERCARYPCLRLKQLDKRYRTKYGMSMILNLKMIKEVGIRRFIRNEKAKWACPECGAMICVHEAMCLSCGYNWNGAK
jgi:hypothetical protein